MCGLTLYISKNVEDDRKLNNTNHRGPDHTIIHKFKLKEYFVSIAFHRLAIIDLKYGNQPFFYKDIGKNRQVYLVCNGEIYNYRELITEYNFDTKSDCHVILDLYLKFGAEHTVKKLDGEFAFIILDITDDKFAIIYSHPFFPRNYLTIHLFLYSSSGHHLQIV
jgi:asparagine synthase (glutamine-hydrolysing)